MSIRIVVVDDHPVTVDGLVQLLSREPDFEVVGFAGNGLEGFNAIRRLVPDIAVLDLRMPEMDGLAVLREMQKLKLPTRPVVFTALEDEDVLEALYLGAQGVVLKDMAARFIVQCIRTVHAGGKWVERDVASLGIEKLIRRDPRTSAGPLTQRELEVARLIGRGLSSKAAAAELNITEGTAKLHLHHVYEKLNLRGRVDLVHYLRKRGLE